MNERYKTQTDEKLKGESWCTKCKQPVDEWKVCFENSIHTDTGYDKVHRCPHCDAKCFADASFEFGCLVFFVGMFGIPVLVSVCMKKFGNQFDFGSEEYTNAIVIGSIVAALLLSIAIPGLWKRILYRRQQANDEVT
ncbi:hypothetical protein N9D23_15740 [Rubripirellula sp.]|nr:hypothetical protein [Rubripirellula sp.]MDF1843711.1 hypothetical protein [Rubripirellula sp.]